MIQLIVTAIIKALDIKFFNKIVTTSFSDSNIINIAKLLPEQEISFKKILQKIYIRE